ncbi:MAG TPA: malto-oligosyltrehalose trehalohydrolase [Acidimicrobiales bacterium]|nr:malto-oligosyltrehalose trehalohydrolase [Acidimicrobiales bacterium]
MTSPLRVWAPAAAHVDLVIDGELVPMAEATGGWHEGPAVAPGTDYLFSVDGGAALPDPRSPWQPHGVRGPSRAVDHEQFTWRTDGVPIDLGRAVIYELHVGTFTREGTFEAVLDRLDHLLDLGVTAIELMPVAEFPGRRGWGYDGVHLWAPHSGYGGPDGLQRLVDGCHARGVAVILDVVYNHLGPDGNVLGEFGPYFTHRYATPWGQAVNLDDSGSDEVRRFFIDNALMWLGDYRFDGLRIDAVHALVDTSAVHVLEQLAVEVAERFPRAVLIAESDLNDPRVVRPRTAGGHGIHAQWSDDFHHALHVALTGERSGYYADFEGWADVATAWTDTFVYAGRHSTHRGRRHGRPVEGVGPQSFLAYLQNHDPVGNRAAGERSAALLSPGRLRIAAAVVVLSPFVPMLFAGEEWGASTPFPYFTDHEDPDLAAAVTEGRRREFAAFGWGPEDVPDPQDPATFASAVLCWDEVATEPHTGLLAWHRELIALRTTLAPAGPGDVSADVDGDRVVLRRPGVTIDIDLAAESVEIVPDGAAG